MQLPFSSFEHKLQSNLRKLIFFAYVKLYSKTSSYPGPGKQVLLLSASYINCELSILRNNIESFTEDAKMSLDHENRNTDALHKNIAFLQNELTEKNKLIKSLMETQATFLDVMTDLRQQPNH